jgi:hypothetical protein
VRETVEREGDKRSVSYDEHFNLNQLKVTPNISVKADWGDFDAGMGALCLSGPLGALDEQDKAVIG